MRISHKHQFVFLAIPRTASTTVRNILNDYSDIKSVTIDQITDEFPFHHHISALDLKKIFKKKGWQWSNYKSFCVVRNPYDKIISGYHFTLRMRAKHFHQKGIIDKVRHRVKDIVRPLTLKNYVMGINPERQRRTSLKNFIADEKGNVLVDDILMYEKLSEELPSYLANLGINITAEDIPHLNATKERREYRDYYDEDTKKRVRDLYTYEISRFDYHF